MPATVLGNIVERSSAPSSQKDVTTPQLIQSDVPLGFPKATHRSQSTFARRRAEQSNTQPNAAPVVTSFTHRDITVTEESSVNPTGRTEPQTEGGRLDDWRKDMEAQNDALVEGMSEDQRKREREELISQLGPDIISLVDKLKANKASTPSGSGAPSRTFIRYIPSSFLCLFRIGPRSAMAQHLRRNTDEFQPSNKAVRKLRFSENPDQVFVYESQPSSPKRVLALLPPRDVEADSDARVVPYSPRTDKGNALNKVPKDVELSQQREEEHTPELIRERYFPNEPPPSDNPTLEWLIPKDEGEITTSEQMVRYDLQGKVIPSHLIRKLPAHLGLHHHGERPEDAGYTLDEIFMLSRSTLPAQRVAMLQVLSRLVHRLTKKERHSVENVEGILKKSLIVAIEAFGERASTPVRMTGLDILWTALTPGEVLLEKGEKVEVTEEQLHTMPLEYLWGAVVYNFSRTAMCATNQIKLFEVLTSLVTSSLKLAEEVIGVHGLLDNAVKSAYSLESAGNESREDIDAVYLAFLKFLQSLATISRRCAEALIPGISDSLLRNIVVLPSHASRSSALSVVASILDFYTILGRYGLGCGITSSAQESFQNLISLVCDEIPLETPEGKHLVQAWMELVEVWIACAINPHQTTPEHDLNWSQVIAWAWADSLLSLRQRLILCYQEIGAQGAWELWAMWWRAWAVWIKGCKVNEIDRGEKVIERWWIDANTSWKNGPENDVFHSASSRVENMGGVQFSTELQLAAKTCHAALLLLDEIRDRMKEVMFNILPIEQALSITNTISQDETWISIVATRNPMEIRIWTNLLVVLVRYIRHYDISEDNLLSLDYHIFHRLMPGDEILASELIADILELTSSRLDAKFSVPEEKWTGGGFAKTLLPLYKYGLWPEEAHFIAPLVPHSMALKMTTTVATPEHNVLPKTPSGGLTGIALPQENEGDWVATPLDILLRSGSTHTRLFRTLPKDWTASETEVVRCLLALLLGRRVPMSRSQLIFTCMKIFMLEHGQSSEEGEEVYRDPLVEKLMYQLLQPLRYSLSQKTPINLVLSSNATLDTIAKAFLGFDQSFYQFYSDFIGLYDSASFGHELFGTLLLPPTSHLYPRDYRRLLWGDYGHIIRSIRVEAKGVLAAKGELKTWLWPLEGHEDGEMLGFYIKALLKHNPSGFLRLIAIHHVAYCLWPDLYGEPTEKKRITAGKVMRAMLTGQDGTLLQDLLCYQQAREGDPVILSPDCYRANSEIIESRLVWATEICGERARSRFPPVLL